jgi:hypothetical protein
MRETVRKYVTRSSQGLVDLVMQRSIFWSERTLKKTILTVEHKLET